MKTSIDRVQFLRGDLRGQRRSIRPPWARPEALFIQNCTRCGDCMPACPQQILVKGQGGFPQIDFTRGACLFCGECVNACRYQAFDVPTLFDTPAWQLAVRITQSCLSLQGVVCRSCGDSCEAVAIRFRLKTGGRSVPEVDSARCNGCGECLAVCPNQSISIQPNQRDCAA